MSGILAVIGARQRSDVGDGVASMLATLSRRGTLSEIWRSDEAILAVARHDWELVDGFSDQVLVVHDGNVSVAADATLYYRDDLLRALAAAGVRPSGRSASHLIAAAYKAWGPDCPVHLEGDFAFVVYDHARHVAFAARDFLGRRPLYYAELDGTLVVASNVGTIVAHPSCPNEFDWVALAEFAGVSLAGHDSTPYKAIKAVPAAMSLLREHGASPRLRRYWHLELNEDAGSESFDAAADRLRSLMATAITERCSPAGHTAMWLSGGYDSPVVFAVGNASLDQRSKPRLRPVSFSYPVGDPGREDELIQEIAEFWNAHPRWLSIEEIPLLRDAEANAARADIPFQHAFENWLRALIGATRDIGARVALQGDGGDQLFAVSTVFLHDLFATMRWRELRREWRAFGGEGARELWRSVMWPVLYERQRAFRRPGTPSLALPTWMNPEFVRRHGLDRRQADAEAALSVGGSWADAETRRSLLNPITPRAASAISAFGLEQGAEVRAPLLDRRIVDFARGRPRSERASGGAVKHLLRRTALELLPASVLAPRTQRTGALTGYFSKGFRSDPDGVVTSAFLRSRLAEAGVVDGAAMQQAWHEYKTTGRGGGSQLFMAFQTEMWLHARDLTAVKTPGTPNELIRMPAAGFLQ